MKNIVKSDKKLRIAFLDFDDIRNSLLGGGQAKVTLEVGKRLSQKGHSVTVYCAKYPGCVDRFENGIFYRHISLATNNIKLNNMFYILSIPFFVPFIKADIIIECFTAPISTLFSPVFTKIPVIGLPTSFEAERFSQKYHLPLTLIEKFGAGFYKYFIAFSKNLEEKIKAYNPSIKTMVISHGVDKSYFQIKLSQPKYFLFLGRLDLHQKGLDLLLYAYASVKNSMTYPLYIAGSGPDENAINELIKKLDLTKNVKLIGRIDGEKKMNYLKYAKALVIPSRQESFCLVALEGLAAGIPLITFDIPGLSWVKKGLSYRIRPFDIEFFAHTLTNVDKKQITKQERDSMKKFATLFLWDHVADEYENFAYQILKGKAQ